MGMRVGFDPPSLLDSLDKLKAKGDLTDEVLFPPGKGEAVRRSSYVFSWVNMDGCPWKLCHCTSELPKS